jgi:hypothetical protein
MMTEAERLAAAHGKPVHEEAGDIPVEASNPSAFLILQSLTTAHHLQLYRNYNTDHEIQGGLLSRKLGTFATASRLSQAFGSERRCRLGLCNQLMTALTAMRFALRSKR